MSSGILHCVAGKTSPHLTTKLTTQMDCEVLVPWNCQSLFSMTPCFAGDVTCSTDYNWRIEPVCGGKVYGCRYDFCKKILFVSQIRGLPTMINRTVQGKIKTDMKNEEVVARTFMATDSFALGSEKTSWIHP
ncbi:unnamed protein product [Natator depressus]